jgi:hypothetical protein
MLVPTDGGLTIELAGDLVGILAWVQGTAIKMVAGPRNHLNLQLKDLLSATSALPRMALPAKSGLIPASGMAHETQRSKIEQRPLCDQQLTQPDVSA